jgi:succinate dehydrogenase / fumarate reductase iron-sulfur subunit
MAETVTFRIWRQPSPRQAGYFEEFKLPYEKNMNVISALMEIQRSPVNAEGRATTPVAWEANCLEEVCGSCTMVINGRVRQACSALVDKLEQPVELRPMTKFPLVRDLMVDRRRMFDALKKVKAWISIDGTYDLGPGPRISPHDQEVMYKLSECMTCGCCCEVCPQFGPSTHFVGPQALSQVRLFNMHPSGKLHAHERLEAVMTDDGITGCGKAQNCTSACPKGIPLVESISVVARDTTKHALFGWLLRK